MIGWIVGESGLSVVCFCFVWVLMFCGCRVGEGRAVGVGAQRLGLSCLIVSTGGLRSTVLSKRSSASTCPVDPAGTTAST